MSDESKTFECATSGKGNDDLKTSAECKMAKSCQKTSYSSNDDECKNRAHEHEQLPKQDCLICFLPMPLGSKEWQYQACCGKLCCKGCAHEIAKVNKPCPFCRTPFCTTEEEYVKRYEERIKKFGDPYAFWQLDIGYTYGTHGLPIDCKKGFGLLLKAAELGSVRAHNDIGHSYSRGIGVEVDTKKANQHFEMAAVGGNVIAMYNLGSVAYNAGNHARAKKHVMVAASAGYDLALDEIRKLFLGGHATKDEFERALRAHKDSADEMKSDARDAAKAYHS